MIGKKNIPSRSQNAIMKKNQLRGKSSPPIQKAVKTSPWISSGASRKVSPPWPSLRMSQNAASPWPSHEKSASTNDSHSETKMNSAVVRGLEGALTNIGMVTKSGETSTKNQGQVFSNKGYNPKPGERSTTKADWKELDSQARLRSMGKDKWKELHRQERLRNNLKDFNKRALTPIDKPVDLTDYRADHILKRHSSGAGKPGKTEFPKSWDKDRILHNISDIATDPNAKVYPSKWGEKKIFGKKDGVVIRTDILGPNSKHPNQISTGYPINVPANPAKNPPKVNTVKNATADIADNIPKANTVKNTTTQVAENTVKSGVLPKLGKAAKIGGKALGVLGTAMDVKELYDSYQADGGKVGENTVTSAGGIAGGWAGGALGAKGGAMGGAAIGTLICPGIGTAVGGLIGSLVGGIAGGLGGRWAGEKIAGAAYDK